MYLSYNDIHESRLSYNDIHESRLSYNDIHVLASIPDLEISFPDSDSRCSGSMHELTFSVLTLS